MENIHYIYIFLDQREAGKWIYNDLIFNFKPFYIGKGKKGRIKSHFANSLLNKNTYKNNIIKKIRLETGELPIHYRIYENLTQEEANKIEIELIKFFGKLSDKNGILTNITDGGEGTLGLKRLNKNLYKEVFQYDLEGNFLKKWECISDADRIYANSSGGSIASSVKRNGTTFGFIWSFDYLGTKIESKKRYYKKTQWKYFNIKQINKISDEIIKTHENIDFIIEKLKLNKNKVGKIYECLNGKRKTAYGFKWEV